MADKKKNTASRLKGFSERFKKLIDKEGLRPLARQTGIGPGTLTSYQDDVSPRLDKLYEIEAKAGVSLKYLIFNEGPMFVKDSQAVKDLLSESNLKKTVTDLQTVYQTISHFEAKIRKSGKSYSPDEVARAVIMLIVLGYGEAGDKATQDIASLLQSE